MKREKIEFDAKEHTSMDTLVREKTFKTRVKLRIALMSYLIPMGKTHFNGDAAWISHLAQQLAFLPKVKSGWGPMDDDIEEMAKNLVDCYLAHRDAFDQAAFTSPSEAALAYLKEFDFAI